MNQMRTKGGYLPPIRVLAVDDSPLFLEAIDDILSHNPYGEARLELVGRATNGEDAILKAQSLKPDIITMDVHMPGMGGLEAIATIMQENPIPILVLTDDPNSTNANFCFEALSRGALEIQRKPALHDEKASKELRQSLKLLASVPVIHHTRPRRRTGEFTAQGKAAEGVSKTRTPLPPPDMSRNSVIAIGASTGGPSVLANVLGKLPEDFNRPIVIAQHLAHGFIEHFVEWLQGQCSLRVVEARAGMRAEPGMVIVGPTQMHVEVGRLGRIRLTKGMRADHHVPAIDRLFRSVATYLPQQSVGVLLTGMGRDGADGLLAMREAGCHTIAQEGSTCAVDGMPAAARSIGAADLVLTPEELPRELIRWVHGSAALGARRA